MPAFIGYTTVFRARLGAIGYVIKLCGPGFIPEPTLLRKLKQELEVNKSLVVADPRNDHVLAYLVEKGLVGKTVRKGARYRFTLEQTNNGWLAQDAHSVSLERVDVAEVDVAMADPRVPSTVGTPTPDNSSEVLEFAYQLGLVTKAKRNLTAAGQALAGLRQADENPFVIGTEALVLMRQLLEHDGLMLKPFASALAEEQSPISRSQFATERFPKLADALVEEVDAGKYRPELRKEARAFRELVRRTARKAGSGSRGPGVLEHRVSPRFEWLCDLRILTKMGLPTNSFSYVVTPDLAAFLGCLQDRPGLDAGSDEVSLAWWRASEGFASERTSCEALDTRQALLLGYRVMRRTIGPAAIREVTLVGCLFAKDCPSVADMRAALIEWAMTESRITLSGGRYNRLPEMVHIHKDLAGAGDVGT